MTSTTNYQEIPKTRSGRTQSERNDVVEDYEWDESKRTETAWTWSRRESKLKKGKRSYGRRSNIIGTTNVADCTAKNKENRSKKRGLYESNQSDTEHQHSSESFSGGLELMDAGGPSVQCQPSSDTEAPSPCGGHRTLHKRAESLPCQPLIHERPRFGSTQSAYGYNSGGENCHPNLKGTRKTEQNWSPIVKPKNHPPSSYSDQSLLNSAAGENKPTENEITITSSSISQHVSSLNSFERCQSPTFSAVSGSSFSSLSRGGEIVITSVKEALPNVDTRIHPLLKPSLDYPCTSSIDRNAISGGPQPVAIDLAEIASSNACITPARSICSSRKRCVCHSPAIDGDEVTSTGGISMGRLSTSSYGSRRARSRIFSPKKLMELESLPCSNPENQVNALRDEFFSPPRSDGSETDGHSTSIHGSENHDNVSNTIIELCVSSHGKENGSFNLPPCKPKRVSSIGGGSFAETVFAPVENKIAKKEVQVFKHISSYQDLKYLVKELRRWSDGKQIVSFGMSKNCTIVPPNKWSSSRKAAFITWTTSYLGFCLRSGGGAVNYLYIKADKAIAIHQDLEDVLIEYKKNNDLFVVKNLEVEPFEHKQRRALKDEEVKAPFSSIKIMTNVAATPLFRLATSAARSATKKLLMSIDRSVFSPLDRDFEENLVGKLNLLNLKMEVSQVMGTTNYGCTHNVTDKDAPLLTTKEVSKVKKKPPRLSYDNSVMDNRDFMSHMHGVSPKYTVKTENVYPSALDIPRRKLSECAGGISPAIQSSISATLSFDGAETPMPKLGCRIWGSRPVRGKDWGQSTRCTTAILSFLQTQLEEAVSLAQSDSLRSSSSCFDNTSMATVIVDSDALGFDFEADTNDNQVGHLGDNEEYLKDSTPSKSTLSRQESLGASCFAALDLNEEISSPAKVQKRQQTSFAKYHRMSICASAMKSRWPLRHSVHSKVFPHSDVVYDETVLSNVFSFLKEYEILCSASVVCTKWADAATKAHASLMLFSVGCTADFSNTGDLLDDDASLENFNSEISPISNSVACSMQRSWDYLTQNFPYGVFLSEGAFKQVYRVWNTSVKAEEAVSVMNVDLISDKNIVGAELSVSVMLSSLVRRNVCPNFVLTRGVFTSLFEPPSSCWGNAYKKKPLGNTYNPSAKYLKPRQPHSTKEGNYQYIRMELCRHGDVEEYIKSQHGTVLHPEESRILFFQMAFALYVARDRFAMKHYDVKLLNFFLQSTNQKDINQDEQPPFTVLRYGVGDHIFNLRMQTSRALIAKLADYGTATVCPDSDGQPVLLSNFTTLENSPPEFMILGDEAQQGYGHDYFGLGLCMLHLFTGHAPYEEILERVTCPNNLKKKLQRIWEDNKAGGYEVIRGVILGDVYEDKDGNLEGEPDNTLYDTFYRFMVLFGIPAETIELKRGNRVWKAVKLCLGTQNENTKSVRASRRNAPRIGVGLDSIQFENDCKQYSFLRGVDKHISQARSTLQKMEGGVDLLLSLVSFIPSKRATALDVINSKFMASLREKSATSSTVHDDIIYSYMAYSSK